MKKSTVTLESLDKKIDHQIDRLDVKIDHLDQKIDSGWSDLAQKYNSLEQKIDSGLKDLAQRSNVLEQKIDSGLNGLTQRSNALEQKIDSMYEFLQEHVLIREEVQTTYAQKMDFTHFKNDFIEAFDHWGKKHDTLDNEVTILRYRHEQLETQLHAGGIV